MDTETRSSRATKGLLSGTPLTCGEQRLRTSSRRTGRGEGAGAGPKSLHAQSHHSVSQPQPSMPRGRPTSSRLITYSKRHLASWSGAGGRPPLLRGTGATPGTRATEGSGSEERRTRPRTERGGTGSRGTNGHEEGPRPARRRSEGGVREPPLRPRTDARPRGPAPRSPRHDGHRPGRRRRKRASSRHRSRTPSISAKLDAPLRGALRSQRPVPGRGAAEGRPRAAAAAQAPGTHTRTAPPRTRSRTRPPRRR